MSSEQILVIGLAILMILLIPIMPRLLRFRITVLHRIGLGFVARWQAERFETIVLFARIMCVGVAVLFFVLAAMI